MTNITTTADKGEQECREAFEKWAITQEWIAPVKNHEPFSRECYPDGDYDITAVRAAWAAWNRRPTNEGQDGLTDEHANHTENANKHMGLVESYSHAMKLAERHGNKHGDMDAATQYWHRIRASFESSPGAQATPADHIGDAKKMVPAGEGVGLPIFGTVQTVQGQTAYVLILDREAKIPTYAKLTDHATATAEIAKRDAEIARLVQAVADHVTVRVEYFAELTTLRAQLAEAQRKYETLLDTTNEMLM